MQVSDTAEVTAAQRRHRNRQRRLAGKVILITGASSGIGSALALACGAVGMKVVVAARRVDPLEAVAQQIRDAGGDALAVPTDITIPAQIDALFAAVLAHYGRLDILVANAGIGSHLPTHQASVEDIYHLIHTNLVGVILCARLAAQYLSTQGSGHILVIGSVISHLVWPNDALYAATKSGLSRFCTGLRHELHPTGVKVTEILPGVIATGLDTTGAILPAVPVACVTDAIVRVLLRPAPFVITPRWYAALIAGNRLFPGVVNRYIQAAARARL